MLIVETIAKIRRYHFVDGKSIKEICRMLRLSRNTVRKVIRSGTTEHRYQRDTQPMPRLDAYRVRLVGLLEEDWQRPRKRRLTSRRLLDLLQSEGYSGGYDSIQRFVKKWREEKSRNTGSGFIPLRFAPGEAYQFDWSHEWVILGGVVQRAKVAHFRLCHSRQCFVVAYPRESLEMVLDAHDRAFAFFGGSCRRGIYDNMATAVDQVLSGKERVFNRRFAQMCSHYLVEPVACTPGSGWEKGQVERQVKSVREWLFTPRPRFKDFAELNNWLADRCREIGHKRPHPEEKERTIREVFEEERASLLPFSAPFDGYTEKECRVTRTSLISYDRNQYSVESTVAGQTATIRAGAGLIRVIKDGKVVGEHTRQFGRDKTIYDPWHYVGILEQKPGALRDGAPFKDWPLPPGIVQVQRRLLTIPGGDREFVAILCAARMHGVDLVEAVCGKALQGGTVRGEMILNLIARELDPPAVDPISTPDALCLNHEPVANCARYDALRLEVDHAAA
jgi:transposase